MKFSTRTRILLMEDDSRLEDDSRFRKLASEIREQSRMFREVELPKTRFGDIFSYSPLFSKKCFAAEVIELEEEPDWIPPILLDANRKEIVCRAIQNAQKYTVKASQLIQIALGGYKFEDSAASLINLVKPRKLLYKKESDDGEWKSCKVA